ncbi:hypothetical protein [Nostoc sp. CHAB 5836]|nr:hypothetical protein [Nostoc sp. CHAB 5836]
MIDVRNLLLLQNAFSVHLEFLFGKAIAEKLCKPEAQQLVFRNP